MALVRYDPLGFGQLQNEINRLFNSVGDTESTAATADWIPTVDIEEYQDRFQLFVDLPGVDPKAVEVTLDNGVLTISGERPAPAGEEQQQRIHRRRERGYGSFHRRFILPETADAEKVNATGRNGVLEIAIAKQEKAQPRRIQVAA